jgi:hypothetical protein
MQGAGNSAPVVDASIRLLPGLSCLCRAVHRQSAPLTLNAAGAKKVANPPHWPANPGGNRPERRPRPELRAPNRWLNHNEHNAHDEVSMDAVRRETGLQACFSLCALCSLWFKAGGSFVRRSKPQAHRQLPGITSNDIPEPLFPT